MKKIIQEKSGRTRVQTINNEPSMTQQQFKDECDINNIISKYQKTGTITHLRRTEGQYLDMSEISDYQTSLNKVIEANRLFDELPSEVRLRFGNDPAQFINFCENPEKNYEEGVKLGLFNKKANTNNEPNDERQPLVEKPPKTPPSVPKPAEQA